MTEQNALLIWERLFPEPENPDVSEAMRCEIRDPLWLLARQWQLGEFKAEDAGMAAFAHVITRTAAPNSFYAKENVAIPLPVGKPLDAVVENLELNMDMATRFEIGRKWRQMLFKAGKKAAWETFCQTPLFQFKEPALDFQSDDPEMPLFYHEPYAQSLAALGNARTVDGFKLFQELSARKASTFLSVNDTLVDALGKEWVNWVSARFLIPNVPANTCWDSSRLEYKSQVVVLLNATETAYLDAPEHHGQPMAWYGWDMGNPKNNPSQPLPFPVVQKHQQTVLPVPVSFPGMPRARWWEMEDSTIDLGNIRTQKTDTGLLLLAEFSLLFSNDWLLIPLKLPIGTLSKIQSLRVTDVFGVQSILQRQNPLPLASTPTHLEWRLFQMPEDPLKDWLWLPPVSAGRLQGEPLEEIKFIRDELANLVWAVEQVVPDGIGGSIEGASTARNLEEWLRTLANVPVPTPLPDLAEKADYAYAIANTVPPHWIPFLPFRPDANKPDIMLRRAAMPRIFEGVEQVTRIRPRTAIVRNSATLKAVNRLDIQEEEIPASGITVKVFWRRARWLDGTTVTWLAREKRLGKTTEASGLQFDVLNSV